APTKLRFPRARRFPETRRAWQRLGGTSTSSSAECRGVAHLRYALRTRGGCSYDVRSSEFIERVPDIPRRRADSQKRGARGNAWEGRAPARPRTAGGAVLLPAGNPPAAVYPRVALEVLV